MTTVLGPLFDQPLHPTNWVRPAGSDDYRVTARFTSPDILNGGQHRAVDVGDGQGRAAPVLAPMTCRVRGRYHFDSARGVEFDLGEGYNLQLWHLSEVPTVAMSRGVSAVGPWRDVDRGERVGTTGNTGARLPNGNPMPYHTHIAMTKDGVPIDPEPFLFGRSLPVEEQMGRFKDVKAGSMFEDDIERAFQLGLMRGTSDDTFEPKRLMPREQVAAVMVRLYDKVIDEIKRRTA